MRRPLALVAAVALGACTASSASTPVPELTSERVVATPIVTPSPTPKPTPKPTPPPTPVPTKRPPPPTARPVPKKVVAAERPNPTKAFRGLGAWVDVFDHNDDPQSIIPHVRAMAAEGTRTLYLETARYASETDIQFPRAVGAALDEAKARKMRVVAWYPPAFGDVGRDVRRSLAAVRFRSPKGNRFDAFAADIEYKAEVPDHGERTERTVEYSKRLRAGVPRGYPLAAITIAPTSLDLVAERWPGFPWTAIGRYYDVVMPMNYWTGRARNAETATKLTEQNTTMARKLSGLPVHVIGGLGEGTDEKQARAYVAAAKRAGSLGGGLYDFRTTRPEVWDELRGLN